MKRILNALNIKTRLDILSLFLVLLGCAWLVVFKIAPDKFGVKWDANKKHAAKNIDITRDEFGKVLTKQEGKEKFFKLIGKTDEQIKTDKIATVYLRGVWLVPQFLPQVFNTLGVGGFYNLSLASTYFFTHGLKGLVKKERPDKGNMRSFPSGHTSGTAVLGGFLHRYYNFKVATPFYMLSVATGLSRIYCERHDVYDVIGGFVIGGFCGFYTNAFALFVITFFRRRSKLVERFCDYWTSPALK